MKTSWVIPGLPREVCMDDQYDKDTSEVEKPLRAAGPVSAPAVSTRPAALPSKVAPKAAVKGPKATKQRVVEQFERGRIVYNPNSQPRDPGGKFRKILARLKTNLGGKELENIVDEVNKADQANTAGDYRRASESAHKVISMIDKIDAGSLDLSTRNGLRRGAAELGRVIAYLPIPQGSDTETVRFSDLPPSSAQLVRELIDRVKTQINSEDAAKITEELQSFISGVRSMTADELSGQLNKLLRMLVD